MLRMTLLASLPSLSILITLAACSDDGSSTATNTGGAGAGGTAAITTAGTTAALGGSSFGGSAVATAGTGGAASVGGSGGSAGSVSTAGTGGVPINQPPPICEAAGDPAPRIEGDDRAPIGLQGIYATDTSNDIGIVGSLYTFADSGGSTIQSPQTCQTEVCTMGTTGQVLNMMYDTTWGVAMGLSLKWDDTVQMVVDYDAAALGITAFGFSIAGLPPGVTARFQVDTADTSYCGNIPGDGYHEINIADLREDCWMAEPPEGTANLRELRAINWFLTTSPNAANDFNFCVSNITAVIGAEPMPLMDAGAPDSGL